MAINLNLKTSKKITYHRNTIFLTHLPCILQSHSKKKKHALAIEHHIPRLSKHSVPADTPEHYTSMTCSKWHSKGQHRSIAASQLSTLLHTSPTTPRDKRDTPSSSCRCGTPCR